MHYLPPPHLVTGGRGIGTLFRGLPVEMRTGDTIRWPSFTKYDGAYIEVLLGNEVFGGAERTQPKSQVSASTDGFQIQLLR